MSTYSVHARHGAIICCNAHVVRMEMRVFSTVIFSPSSRGQLALIIYEWDDARYIGIDADGSGAGENMWEDEVG